MSVRTANFEGEEPPISTAAALAGKMSQGLLLILCVGPIAIFALALAHRGFQYLFP